MQRVARNFIQDNKSFSLLSLLDKNVLQHLLSGYCSVIQSGLSVIFKLGDGELSIKTLGRMDALEEKARDVFYPLCRYFRTECGCDQVCQDFDREIALKYYRGQWDGPKLYRCPLQLWDMTYPLRFGGKIAGVLFAGQVVTREEMINWRKLLSGLEEQVVWGNFFEEGNQVEDVCNAIGGMRLDSKRERKAQELVRGESRRGGKNIHTKALLEKYEGFLEFGQMMETLLGQFYQLMHLAWERSLFAEVLRALHDINARILSAPMRIQTLEHIGNLAKQVFSANQCHIWEYDAINESFRPKPSTGLETEWRRQSPRSDGIGIEVIKTGKHLFVDKMERLHEEARKKGIVCSGGFPLQLKGAKPVGVLYLHFVENPHLSEEDLRMVDLFSYNAGLAIQLAELREKNERRIRDLQTLRSANISVAKAKKLEESLELVVEAAVDVMHAHAAILYPYDEKTGKFKRDLVTARGIDMSRFEFEDPRPAGTGLTQKLMASDEPLWVKDVENAPEKQVTLIEKIRRHVMRPNSLQSFIGVGLRSDQERLGVLYVFFKEPHKADNEELIALGIFAGLGATRIQLAKLSEARRQAAESDAMALFGLVATTLAHRLENVAGIIPVVIQDIEELLRKVQVSDVRIWERLGDLRGDVERLLELENNLPKKNVGKLVAIDLAKVINGAIKGAGLEKINPDTKVSVDIASGIKQVKGVEALLIDIFINLLQNAAQANAKSVSIVAIERPKDKLVDILVKDNGDGIAEKDLPKVLTPFFSTKEKDKHGTTHGKGLWVARHEIDQMDGQLSMNSKYHKGTTFTVSLRIFDE